MRQKLDISAQDLVTHASLLKIIIDDDLECVFPNVEISLRIFLTLMVTNCSTERSFSHLKQIKNHNRSVMVQGRLDSCSLFMIHPDLVRKLDVENLIKDFARKKSRKRIM